MVPKPNPGNTGDDKNKHEDNERIYSDPQPPSNAANAYGHVTAGTAQLKMRVPGSKLRVQC